MMLLFKISLQKTFVNIILIFFGCFFFSDYINKPINFLLFIIFVNRQLFSKKKSLVTILERYLERSKDLRFVSLKYWVIKEA